MTRTFAAAMRRGARLMRPAKAGKVTRSMGKVMTGLMVDAAFAPLTAKSPKVAGKKPAHATKAKVRKTSGPLGVVLHQLRVARALMPVAQPATPARTPAIPKGARYLSKTHKTAAGEREYRLYIPARITKRPKGLILMLHGCNQSADDFAIGTHMNGEADKHGLVIVYPIQKAGDNAASCWNWFKPANQVRGKGEPAALVSLTRKLIKEYGLSRESVFVAGLSAGGAMAAILVDVYPDVFSAAGIHSGLTRGAARDVLSAMTTMKTGVSSHAADGAAASPPTRRIVFHGDSDSTVHPSNGAMVVAAALGEGRVADKITKRSVRGRGYVRHDFVGPAGGTEMEYWTLDGGGHAWSGGRAAGSYTDRAGPDASAQMVRFFLAGAGKVALR